MAARKPTASGTTGGGDTSFRRTFNRDEYLEKAKESDRKRREEGEARAAATAAGKKYFRRAETPPDAKDTSHRTSRVDVSSRVGTSQLVGAGATVGRRGKGAGFYCEACDETYRDSSSLLDHYISKRHLSALGETGKVAVADVSMVRDRLRWLCRLRREQRKDVVVNLDARLEMSRANEEKEREEKRQKRNAKRRKTPGGVGIPTVKIENDGIIN